MQRSSNIRVRLLFEDCTPFRPGSVGRRKCWFLLNVDACRRVTDVEYCIQKTFCLGESSQIELLLDDFILPPFEKSEIIKENDLIRVRLIDGNDIQEKEEDRKEPKSDRPRKKKKSNTEADLPRGSNATQMSSTRKKKTQKEKKGSEDDKSMKGQNVPIEKEKVKLGHSSKKDHSVRLAVSPLTKNGTPKYSTVAHKHVLKSTSLIRKVNRTPCDSSSSCDSTSEDEKNAKGSSKVKRLHKVASKRKVLPTKTTSSTLPPNPLKPGTSSLASKQMNLSSTKRNGTGPVHSDSESSSTNEEVVARNTKHLQKASGSGLPSKGNTSAIVKTLGVKATTTTGTADSSSSSSLSSLSSASSSSDTDEEQPSRILQKQKMQTSTTSGTSSQPKATELLSQSSDGKGLLSRKSAAVKKSKSKSSAGHVRFSSDTDSESEEVDDPEAIGPQLPSGWLPSEHRDSEQRTAAGGQEMADINSVELEGPPEMPEEGKDHCNSQSSFDQTDGSVTDAIQAKLLKIAGQETRLPSKPKQTSKQPSKPKEKKPPKDYSIYPPLVGPPRTGDMIAYKILELSNSYTPEVSAYKEGEVLNFNHSNSMIEMRLTDVEMAAEPSRDGGRFEMEPDEDQVEQVEPLSVDRLVLVTLPSLIEPKLVT